MQLNIKPMGALLADAATGQLHQHHGRAPCAGRRRGEACVARRGPRSVKLRGSLVLRSADQVMSLSRIIRLCGRYLERTRITHATLNT